MNANTQVQASTISSAVLLLWRALESCGCDGRALFAQVDLDPDRLHDPNARYPFTALTRLWKLAAAATRDPCLGLTVARFWHPTTFHALGYSWMASQTLKDALMRMARYSAIVTDAVSMDLTSSAEGFEFTLQPKFAPPADEAIDAGMAIVLGMCRTSYGSTFNPLRVTMQRDTPAIVDTFSQVFRAPIQFSAPENMLLFSNADLTAPLPTANAELARANDRVITGYLARFTHDSIKIRVEAKLLEQLSSGRATQGSIAKALAMSPRTLQRNLKQEGTSYKQLLDDMRRQLASQYIKESRLSVNEITFMLGFSEPANFSRAFRRWTGVSPSGYRLS
jgi:AraC-like DNA-binding protein